ncbi:MAG: hypothetical protein SFY80_00825 [Verrucomicrobiota bacterium]|nr:hypothetical protein [Verrucomicrobiota bacterium]
MPDRTVAIATDIVLFTSLAWLLVNRGSCVVVVFTEVNQQIQAILSIRSVELPPFPHIPLPLIIQPFSHLLPTAAISLICKRK